MIETGQILICAGDPSGDHQAAHLVRALREVRPELRFWGPGGPELAAAGSEVTEPLARLSAIGLLDVLPSVPRALAMLRRTIARARATPPRLAILVDAGAFNLRLGKALKRHGVPSLGYFPPGSWSGSARRAAAVAEVYSRVATPFPQAMPAYAQLGLPANLVGHPLVDELAALAGEPAALPSTPPVLCLLPGSRGHEIRHMLTPMLAAARLLTTDLPGLQVVLSRAPSAPRRLFDRLVAQADLPLRIVSGSREAMVGATAGLVKSGTVTLEAALLGLPFVGLYRTSLLAYCVAWLYYWPKPEFWLMPNVLLGRMAVPQRFQFRVNGPELAAAVRPLLCDTPVRRAMQADLAEARAKLGGPGATGRAVAVVLEMLDQASGP